MKNITKQVLVLAQAFAFTSMGLGGNLALAKTASSAIKINPETLRQQLLESNLPITQALNAVKDGKDQVSVARGQLFPSLNLGAMLSSGTTFGLSSVQFLVPFLLPSNWFNYKAQKQTFEADKMAFQIMELNTYSSALSLYYTILSDQEVNQIYIQEASDLQKIAEIGKRLVSVGTMAPADNNLTEATAELAGVQASKLSQMAAQEISSLRMALGLPLSTEIILEKTDTLPSPLENHNIQSVVDQALSVAPERRQVQFLVNAAKDKKWSTVFGFINGLTLSASGQSGGSVSLSNIKPVGSVSLGFSLFPTIKLSNRNIEEVQLLDTELTRSTTQVLESAMKSLHEAKYQFDAATKAEKLMTQVYKVTASKNNVGLATVLDLLFARTKLTESALARVQAEANLNLQRIVLHRTLLSASFEKIKGCSAVVDQKIKGKVSLDQVCRPEAVLQAKGN